MSLEEQPWGGWQLGGRGALGTCAWRGALLLCGRVGKQTHRPHGAQPQGGEPRAEGGWPLKG